MYFKKLLIHTVVLVICISTVVGLKKDIFYCEKASPCVCVSVNNNNIDLNGLNVSLNIAANITLNYQPCPNSNSSADIVSIEIENASANTTELLSYTNVNFEINDAVVLIYTNDTKEFDVILSCDSAANKGNEYLINYQNDIPDHYSVVLKTSQVCGLNLKDAIENHSSNTWTFFFSFILVVLFVYFVGGSVMNACLFNQMGIDMIPHHEFWLSLCSNIKEKLCGKSMMASAYESI